MDGSAQRLDRLTQQWPDCVFEFDASDPDDARYPGECDADARLNIGRERLLRSGTLLSQRGQCGQHGIVVLVKLGELLGNVLSNMFEHCRVEVDSAESLDPARRTKCLEAIGGSTENGGVERPSAKVIHGDRGAFVDAFRGRIVEGRGFRLGDQCCRRLPGENSSLPQGFDLERTPVGRVGQGHRLRVIPLEFVHLRQNVSQYKRHESISREWGAIQHDRCFVTDAAFEFPGMASRLLDRPTRGRLADEQFVVLAQVDRGRHDCTPVAKRDDLDPAVAVGRGCRECCP